MRILFENWRRFLVEKKDDTWNSAHVVMLNGDKVLLVQRCKKDHWKPLKWAFPGGNKEDKETLEQGLVREIEEEVGFSTDEADLAYLPEISHKLKHAFYACKKRKGKLELNANGVHEHEDVKWATVKQIKEMDTVPDVLAVIEAALDTLGGK